MRENAKKHRSLNGEILHTLTFAAERSRRYLEVARTLPESHKLREEIAKKYPKAPIMMSSSEKIATDETRRGRQLVRLGADGRGAMGSQRI